MKNKEKYFDRIIELIAQDIAVSKKSNTIELCEKVPCSDCIFNNTVPCFNARKSWLEAEYKEQEIDWSKVPVDTPIMVWDGLGSKRKRYFNKCRNGQLFAWENGRTSYTTDDEAGIGVIWQHAEIAPGIDCTRWYKGGNNEKI